MFNVEMLYYHLPVQIHSAEINSSLSTYYQEWLSAYNDAVAMLHKLMIVPSNYLQFYTIAQHDLERDGLGTLPKLALRSICKRAYADWRAGRYHSQLPPLEFEVHKDLFWVRKRESRRRTRDLTFRVHGDAKLTVNLAKQRMPSNAFFNTFALAYAVWHKIDTTEFALTLVFKIPFNITVDDMITLRMQPNLIIATKRQPTLLATSNLARPI